MPTVETPIEDETEPQVPAETDPVYEEPKEPEDTQEEESVQAMNNEPKMLDMVLHHLRGNEISFEKLNVSVVLADSSPLLYSVKFFSTCNGYHPTFCNSFT